MEKYGIREYDDLMELSQISSVVETPQKNTMGTTTLYLDGQRRFIPMPTPDPKDPLNLPNWRKWAAILTLCIFGGLALAAEFIIGALVPVFALEYAGIDPKILGKLDLSSAFPKDSKINPLDALSKLGGPPIWKIALLSSLPLLVNGIAAYVLVPVSIAVGRRPVILFAALMAWTGGLWAGFSSTLDSHLAARCFMGLGAGAVEALIPLIIQDFMFIHQRNKAIACIGASQGLIIVGLGVMSPLIIVNLGWRYIYYITSGVGFFGWLLIIGFVPETRWIRTPDELVGKEVYVLRPGELRPRLDVAVFGPRNNKTDFGLFIVTQEWRLAAQSIAETLKTTLFPNVLWVITVNSIFVSLQGAAGQVGSSVLIASGWSFFKLGLVVVPIVIATPFVWLMGGLVADKISNYYARRNGGRREPESHLISLVAPLVAGVVGSFLFGYVGENVTTTSPFVLLTAIFLIGFSFLTANTLFSVYLVESYPAAAGPVLINASSFRLLVGFALSFDATSWVESLGFLKSFGMYALALGIMSLLLPLVYIYGPRLRRWTSRFLRDKIPDELSAHVRADTDKNRLFDAGSMKSGKY